MPLAATAAALRAEGHALDVALEQADGPWHARPTRLPAWDLSHLVAHLVRGVERVEAYLSAPEPPTADVHWLGYWRAARARADHTAIAGRAVAEAASSRPEELLDRWHEGWTRAAALADSTPPERLIASPFGAIRIDHYLTSRVVEAAVHGLDLREALRLEQVVTPQAREIACRVLDGLLGRPRPADLVDDDVVFLLAATGRLPHTDPDLPVLH